jgi:hypothetical protein
MQRRTLFKMSRDERAKYLRTFFGLMVVVAIVIGVIYRRTYEEQWQTIDSATLNDVVDSIQYDQGIAVFWMRGDPQRYRIPTDPGPAILSRSDLRADIRNFNDFLEKGDTLIKRTGGDSIFMQRNGRRYGWRISR